MWEDATRRAPVASRLPPMLSGRVQIADWVDRYERAWRTAGTDHLGDLFTDDATYSMTPFEDTHRGLAAIAKLWEAERQGPGEEFTMQSEVVAVEGDTGVVRCEVFYGEPHNRLFRDLWIIRLDDSGRCFHFEEWPFWPDQPSS
jgi:ketosteroid isomerase-like protein